MNACWKSSFGLICLFLGIGGVVGGAKAGESILDACIFTTAFIVPGILVLRHVFKQHRTDIDHRFPLASGTLFFVLSFLLLVAAFAPASNMDRLADLLDSLIFAAIGGILFLWSQQLKSAWQTADASSSQTLAEFFSSMNSSGAKSFSKMLNQMGSGQSASSKPEERRPLPAAAPASSSARHVLGILVFASQPLGKSFEKLLQKIVDQQRQEGHSIAANLVSGEEAVDDLNDKEFMHGRILKKFSASSEGNILKDAKAFSFRASNGSLGKYYVVFRKIDDVKNASGEGRPKEDVADVQFSRILSDSNVGILLDYGLARRSSSSKYLMTKDGILYVDGMLCSKRHCTEHPSPSNDLIRVSRGRMILLKCSHLTALSHIYLWKYGNFIVEQSMLEGRFDYAEVALQSLAGCFSHISRHYIEEGNFSNALELLEKHRKGWAASNSSEAKFVEKILRSWPAGIEKSIVELNAIHSSPD